MNPSVPDKPRYRNDTVFRSAERLIASRPPPRRRHPLRWLVVLIALVCGLSVMFWWRFGRGGQLGDEAAAPAAATPVRSPAEKSLASPSAASVPPPASAPTAEPASTAAGTREVRTARSTARVAPVKTPGASAFARLPAAGVGAAAPASTLLLFGELRGVGIEMILHLRPTTNRVEGVLVFSGAAERPPVALAGSWNLESILVRAQSGLGGYDFALEFPTTSSGDFEGSWVDGKDDGVLTLKIAPPFVGRRTNR